MDPLATAGELETHLQREIDADVAGQALQLASGAVRAFCKWDLSYVAETTLHAEGTGGAVLTLPTLRLLTVTQVRIDGVIAGAGAIAVTVYNLGQLYYPCGFRRHASVQVDCSHGYTEIPDLVKLVTVDLASRRVVNPQNLIAASTGQVSREWSPRGGDVTLSALHERLLERYSI